MISSQGSTMGGSPKRKTDNMMKHLSNNTIKINTRKDSTKNSKENDQSTNTATGWKNISLGKNNGSRNFNSSASKNENILKINDENDETFDRDFTGTEQWMGHSKGYSLRMTPKTTIVPERTEETARIHRAYHKHSHNLMDWSQTITKINNHRSQGRSKFPSPNRSLVQLQDQY